jgi:hypothetical protein
VRYLNKESEWRDRGMANFAPEEITDVKIAYGDTLQKKHSFHFFRNAEKKYSIEPLYSDKTTAHNTPPDPAKVEAFLNSFQHLIAESLGKTKKGINRDSLLAQVPFSTITLRLKNGKEHELALYTTYAGHKKEDLPSREALLRYYVFAGEEQELFIAQHNTMKSILYSYNGFFRLK